MSKIDLSNQKVLVTGATGFLGSRLVEKLVLEHNAQVRALVRNFSKAARIARFPIEMVRGDVSNPADVEKAVKGCDIIIHCAWMYSDKANEKEANAKNISGLEYLLSASQKFGIKRFVFVSTVAVYPYQKNGVISEDVICRNQGENYADTKLLCERIVRSYGKQNVPVVIVQPTVIYGPWSTIWTVSPLTRLKKMYLALDEGMGMCNAVFVDDVVQGLVLAVVEKKAIGETFLISGPKSVCWKEFYGAYERMLGVNSLLYLSLKQLAAYIRWQKFLENPIGKILMPIRKFLREYPAMVKGYLSFKSTVGRVEAKDENYRKPTRMPNEMFLKLYQSKASVSIEKAKLLLNYKPGFDFKLGMAMTEKWAQWANLL